MFHNQHVDRSVILCFHRLPYVREKTGRHPCAAIGLEDEARVVVHPSPGRIASEEAFCASPTGEKITGVL